MMLKLTLGSQSWVLTSMTATGGKAAHSTGQGPNPAYGSAGAHVRATTMTKITFYWLGSFLTNPKNSDSSPETSLHHWLESAWSSNKDRPKQTIGEKLHFHGQMTAGSHWCITALLRPTENKTRMGSNCKMNQETLLVKFIMQCPWSRILLKCRKYLSPPVLP